MIKKLAVFLRIQSDLDTKDNIHDAIAKSIVFRGTNLWILVFAIVIASVGLNMNSTAVIIGAMLISPLMGPINGMGYSIATYDFPLLRRALRNFTFAVAASLTASTVYFAITPLSIAHSELLARTSPSIYDVIIALFGGLAGIVAITSKHKGNVIPGVAIATALMPPLCTAGYGLATAQFTYFFGAFYLFTINTVFIGISSVLFSQFVKLPIRAVIDDERKRKINQWVTAVIVVTIIPSVYFGYLLVQKERFTKRANLFIASVSDIDGNYLLRYDIEPGRNSIRLVYGGTNFHEWMKDSIHERARRHKLEDATIQFEQGFSTNDISQDITQVDKSLRAEIGRLAQALQKNQQQKNETTRSHVETSHLLQELETLFPQVTSLTRAEGHRYSRSSPPDSTHVVLIILSTNPPHLRNVEKQRVKAWISQRLAVQHVELLYQQEVK